MSTKVKVRKADAEKVLSAVKAAFRPWLSAGSTPPKLVKNYDWLDGNPAPYAVIWEEGPYEWAYLFPHGGIDAEFGFRVKSVADRVPDDVFVEPYTSWSIAIYPSL